MIIFLLLQYKHPIGTIALVLYNLVAGNIFQENLTAS